MEGLSGRGRRLGAEWRLGAGGRSKEVADCDKDTRDEQQASHDPCQCRTYLDARV